MAIFEVYTKEVEINGNKYKIRPLSGRFLPQLYSLIAKFSKGGEDAKPEEVFADKEVVKDLYDLSFETMKKSYPNEDPVAIEEFVSQNLLKFTQVLMEVNLPKE